MTPAALCTVGTVGAGGFCLRGRLRIRPAGRELPSPAAHVPRLDPRLPKLDFDPNKPYVSKTVGIEIPTDRPAPTRPQRPVAALLGGFGKK